MLSFYLAVNPRYVTVYARKYTDGKGKEHTKAPKVQRLVTPLTLQRKRKRLAIKKGRISKVLPRPLSHERGNCGIGNHSFESVLWRFGHSVAVRVTS